MDSRISPKKQILKVEFWSWIVYLTIGNRDHIAGGKWNNNNP